MPKKLEKQQEHTKEDKKNLVNTIFNLKESKLSTNKSLTNSNKALMAALEMNNDGRLIVVHDNNLPNPNLMTK